MELAYLCSPMAGFADILSSSKGGILPLENSDLVLKKERNLPGSWNYSIRRYKRMGIPPEDAGTLIYHFGGDAESRFLELRFCVSGQTYCSDAQTNCEACILNRNAQCVEQTDTIDHLSFRFEPAHLTNLIRVETQPETEDIIRFRHPQSFSRSVAITGRIRHTLDSLLNHRYSDTLENIFVNAQTQILLLYTLESVSSIREDEVPACKFLMHQDDREKIIKAREVLLEHIGDPITIKELSRKAAINECYLKKGFKVMFGTTIFDFYQEQRMEHARYLLYEKGMSVSEVSAQLGYSSISHFSTAFKKHTGLKPCELLSPLRHK
jgi:AraC-like DNA-binding protein